MKTSTKIKSLGEFISLLRDRRYHEVIEATEELKIFPSHEIFIDWESDGQTQLLIELENAIKNNGLQDLPATSRLKEVIQNHLQSVDFLGAPEVFARLQDEFREWGQEI